MRRAHRMVSVRPLICIVWSPDDKGIDFFQGLKEKGNTVAQLQCRNLLFPVLVELPAASTVTTTTWVQQPPPLCVQPREERKEREKKKRGEGLGFLSPPPSSSSAPSVVPVLPPSKLVRIYHLSWLCHQSLISLAIHEGFAMFSIDGNGEDRRELETTWRRRGEEVVAGCSGVMLTVVFPRWETIY
jgi:hypothetical protein